MEPDRRRVEHNRCAVGGLLVFGLRFHVYPVMLYTGASAGVLLGTRWAALNGLPAGKINAAMLLLLLPALAGARLLFVASRWGAFRHDLTRIGRCSEGGAALYGGLILALLCSIPLLRALRVDWVSFWDAATISLLVGMIFTRMGCMFHGCCAGRPSARFPALYLPDCGGRWQKRVPTQLLEAMLAGLLLACSGRIVEWLPFPGSLFLSALAVYGLGRWCLDPWRETVDGIGRMSVSRAISGALMGLSATGLLVLSLWRR